MKKLIITICILLSIISIGCSKDSDDDVNVPASKVTYNPVAQDEDDKILNTPSPTYPSIPGHGILWKPVSESDGKLVVLLNRSYGKPNIYIKNSRNQVVAQGKFVYFSNPDRATYRFTRPGSSFSGGYLIIGSKVFAINNGGVRQE